MKILDIREMIKLVNQYSVDELEWEYEETRIFIKKFAPVDSVPAEFSAPVFEIERGSQQAAVALIEEQTRKSVETVTDVKDQSVSETRHIIASPTVGLFQSVLKQDEQVKSGYIIGNCVVESLQISHEIRSEVEGKIVEVLAEDGQLVGYGEPLFIIKTM
ncbi:biotin/lipoyl-containing protein [Effusibacillus consociatus]|uniref:Biotin/lipoyl-containing protein n=1 Tax=Effusibacillus consociatus TaxID=1117041 RepID=A0ABV9Q683_9BACL